MTCSKVSFDPRLEKRQVWATDKAPTAPGLLSLKKSSNITLGLLATLAVAFTSGCNRTAERRDCVDEQNRIVGQDNCVNAETQRRGGYGGYIPYHWLYGGSSGGRVGDTVFNGNSAPGMRGGSSMGSPSGTTRGGFGSFFGGGS